MSAEVAPIVEGHGDVDALPVLLRKIRPDLVVRRPVRIPRSRLTMPDHLERAARIAASNLKTRGLVLLVMDADDDCAATLGPALQKQLSTLFPSLSCRVALAVREFEAWIVGGDERFSVDNADIAGNLKGRIEQLGGSKYRESVDQPRWTATASLERLRMTSRSFRHLEQIVQGLE